MPRNDLTLIRLLAYMYMRFAAFEKAETLFAALVVLDPNDSLAAKGQAWSQLESGQAQAALDVLDSIGGPGEPGAVVQLLRARAFACLGRSEDAQVAMRSFLLLRAAVGDFEAVNAGIAS